MGDKSKANDKVCKALSLAISLIDPNVQEYDILEDHLKELKAKDNTSNNYFLLKAACLVSMLLMTFVYNSIVNTKINALKSNVEILRNDVQFWSNATLENTEYLLEARKRELQYELRLLKK